MKLRILLAIAPRYRSPSWSTLPRAHADEDIDAASMQRFLFYAVLEGLYDKGLQEEVVDAWLDATGPGYFVPKCPICMPVEDALRVYRQSPRIGSWEHARVVGRGFGSGYSAAELQAFGEADREARMASLEALVASCVQRRFELLRLDAETRAALELQLKLGRKQGMAGLSGDFGKRCASCDGANQADE